MDLFKRFFWWDYFRGSLFLEEWLVIGGNFAFYNRVELDNKKALNNEITDS